MILSTSCQLVFQVGIAVLRISTARAGEVLLHCSKVTCICIEHAPIYMCVYVHIYNCAYVEIQNTINFNIAGNFTWYFFHIIQTRKLLNMLKYMINFT